MRKHIYQIIEPGERGNTASIAYDILMMIAIIASIIPLMFVEDNMAFRIIEWVTVSFFILDYLLRWITADFRMGKGKWSFVLYPVSA